MRAKAAGAARTRGAAGLGRVPVRPEVGDDPDRRASPLGGLREGEAGTGWVRGRRWAGGRGGLGPREEKGERRRKRKEMGWAESKEKQKEREEKGKKGFEHLK